MVAVYERPQRFRQEVADEMVSGLVQAFAAVGACSDLSKSFNILSCGFQA